MKMRFNDLFNGLAFGLGGTGVVAPSILSPRAHDLASVYSAASLPSSQPRTGSPQSKKRFENTTTSLFHHCFHALCACFAVRLSLEKRRGDVAPAHVGRRGVDSGDLGLL